MLKGKPITREQFDKKSDKAKYDNYVKYVEEYARYLRESYDKYSEIKELRENIKSLEEIIKNLERKVKYMNSPIVYLMIKNHAYEKRCDGCLSYNNPYRESDCYYCSNERLVRYRESYVCKHFEISVDEDDNYACIDIVDDNYDSYYLDSVEEIFDMTHDKYLYKCEEDKDIEVEDEDQ